MGAETFNDEKARFRHWCEVCEAPSWFHQFTNKYDDYAYYFCNESTVESVGRFPFKRQVVSVCNNKKYTMENDEYSEGNHENAVPLEIEGIYDDEEEYTEKSNDRAFSTGWSVMKGGVKNWLHDMVYEVKGLVENQQINPMEAARLVAEQNDPNDRQLGRLLFTEYVRMTNEDLL